MRRLRQRAILTAATGIFAVLLTGASAQAGIQEAPAPLNSALTADGTPSTPLTTPPSPRFVPPTPSGSETEDRKDGTSTKVCGPPFIDNDRRLGPVLLPKTGVLGEIVEDYVPLGGLEPDLFLYRYRQPNDRWRYPPDAGFAHEGGWPNGRPLAAPTILTVGTLIDRFGPEATGAFVSPVGASFEGRAIPPDNLNTFDPQRPCNYYIYRVIKEFTVDGGPAERAFQQQGGDTQYHLLSKYIPTAPQTAEEVTVKWLLDNDYLERAN